jgi:peptidoglycan/LPS O-acetylase OafA/YrhL
MGPGQRKWRRALVVACAVLALLGFLAVPHFAPIYGRQADLVAGAGRDFGIQMLLYGLFAGTRSANLKLFIAAYIPILLGVGLALLALFAVQDARDISWYPWASMGMTVLIAVVVMFRSPNVFTTYP